MTFLLVLSLGCTAPPDSRVPDETGVDSAGDSADSGQTDDPGALVLPSMAGLNVIVIQVDTLRADHLPAYGYDRDTTPELSRYPWHVITGTRPTGPWTLPSTASLLTGLFPQHHLQLIYNEDHTTNTPLTAPTYAQRLHEQGWESAMFSGNGVVSPYTGLESGFDTAVFALKGEADGGPNGGGTMGTLAASALEWLDQRVSTTPFLIHLQPMNMHQTLVVDQADIAAFRSERVNMPVDALGGYTYDGYSRAYDQAVTEEARAALHQSLLDVYDGAVRSVDRETSIFLDALDERGLLAHTVVVFTSDHGETLDDDGHGAWGHGNSVREELTRVPLMILQPGVPAAASTCVSSNADVWPTLWSALGLPPVDGLDGVDLALGCRSEADSLQYDVEGLVQASSGNERGKLAVRCLQGSVQGTNVGDGADVDEATAVADVQDGQALLTALHAYVDDLGATVDGVNCAF